MSGAELAGALTERLTRLTRDAARDDLGGASGGWVESGALWAAIRSDGAAASDDSDAPGLPMRWRALVRAPCAVAVDDRLRWGTKRLRVRVIEADLATPDRLTLRLEEER